MGESGLYFISLLIFNLIATLPYYFLLIHPFLDRLRFSHKVMGVGYVIAYGVTFLSLYAAASTGIISIAFISHFLMGIIFGVVFVDDLPGKPVMTYIILFDLMQAAMAISKSIEHVMFEEQSYTYFGITHSLFFFIVTMISCAGDFVYSKRTYAPALKQNTDSVIWNLAWAVPFGFTVNIYTVLYIVADDYLEFCFNFKDILSLVAVGICGIIMFYMIVLLINEQSEKHRILEKEYQYKNELNHDLLTKAYSRRFGLELLERSIRHKDKSIIMMTDIDAFKEINDKYGHESGDRALIEFTRCLNQCLRNTDTVIRWGGDEFICIFEGLKQHDVNHVADKIRRAVHTISISHEIGPITLTCSMGFTMIHENDTEINDILQRADEALYRAKEEGKDNYSIIW